MTTGLTEGSYIQITKGGAQPGRIRRSIVEVDQPSPSRTPAVRHPPVPRHRTARRRRGRRRHHGRLPVGPPPSARAPPGRAGPLLELEAVSRVYGEEVEVYALREVSLQIMPGEFMSIVGPVGSGKSTMLGSARRPRSPHVGHRPHRRAGRERRSTTRPRSQAAGRLHRLRLPAVPPHPPPDRAGQRRDGAALPRHPAQGAAGAGPRRPRPTRAWPLGPITGRCRCPEASSSGWPWPGPS